MWTPRWPHVHVSPTIMFRAGACAGAEVLHMNVCSHETAVHTDHIFIKRGTNNFSFEPTYGAAIHVVAIFGAGLPFKIRL